MFRQISSICWDTMGGRLNLSASLGSICNMSLLARDPMGTTFTVPAGLPPGVGAGVPGTPPEVGAGIGVGEGRGVPGTPPEVGPGTGWGGVEAGVDVTMGLWQVRAAVIWLVPLAGTPDPSLAP